MNKEIEEILYMLKSVVDDPKSTFHANATICCLLLDYITNLQLENNQLKQNYKIQLEYDECLENKLKEIKDTCKYYKKYKDEWFEEECKNALDDIRDIVLGGEDNESN